MRSSARRRAGWAVAAAAMAVLAGCGSGSASCAAITAELPGRTEPGATVTVHLSHLLATCPDTGGGPPAPMDVVRIDAVWAAQPGVVVASTSAPVADDATAEASLLVPSGSGELRLKIGDQTVGHVAVGLG